MNLEDLAKKTISEVSYEIEEKQRQKEVLKNQAPKKEIEFEVVQAPEFYTKELTSKEEVQKEEVQNTEQKQQKQEEVKEQKTEIEQQILDSNLKSEENEELSSEVLNASVIMQMQNLGEDIFLKNLRERILVLFEGLNHIKKEDLEQRLNLTINFLEFLLASIEYKLKK
ncbi:MAG: 2-oxoglutarate:acceptor oxidoreductase [Campylobacter sp.]|nr:2-oxoglutarate:acceptor oxidoreductase [Campylobacter sp.]